MTFEELRGHIEALMPNATITIDYRDGGIVIQDTGFKLDLDGIDAEPSELVGDDLDNTPVVDRNV